MREKWIAYNRRKSTFEITKAVWKYLFIYIVVAYCLMFLGIFFPMDLVTHILFPNDIRLIIHLLLIVIVLPFVESYLWHKQICKDSDAQIERYKDK